LTDDCALLKTPKAETLKGKI